jgi:hypothetical protein
VRFAIQALAKNAKDGGAPGTVRGEALGIPHLKIEMWGTRFLLEGEKRWEAQLPRTYSMEVVGTHFQVLECQRLDALCLHVNDAILIL